MHPENKGGGRKGWSQPNPAKYVIVQTIFFFVYPKNNKVNLAGCVLALIKTGSSLSKFCFLLLRNQTGTEG